MHTSRFALYPDCRQDRGWAPDRGPGRRLEACVAKPLKTDARMGQPLVAGSGASRVSKDPCGDVMKCHVRSCAPPEMSCFVMRGRFRRAVGAFLLPGCGEGFGGGGRFRSCVPPSRQRAGRGVPVSRVIARAWARGRGRAYRGGAARAPDCARETPDAPRPSVPAGVFFAAPSHCFLQKRRKAAPEAASLYFHSTPYRQMSSSLWNKK